MENLDLKVVSLGATTYGWFAGAIATTFYLLIIFSNMAIYNAQIVCPQSAESIQEAMTGSGANILTQISTMIGVFFSPCSGLDWWVYLLVFIPMVAGIIAFLTPLVGS